MQGTGTLRASIGGLEGWNPQASLGASWACSFASHFSFSWGTPLREGWPNVCHQVNQQDADKTRACMWCPCFTWDDIKILYVIQLVTCNQFHPLLHYHFVLLNCTKHFKTFSKPLVKSTYFQQILVECCPLQTLQTQGSWLLSFNHFHNLIMALLASPSQENIQG